MKVYREMVRNTVMGIQAIDNVLPYVEDSALIKTMREQKELLQQYCNAAKNELTKDEVEDAEGSKLGKTMLKASASFSAMLNRDKTHIAEMLIEGYEMGIVSMQKCVNEMEKEHEEVPVCAKDLIKTYDKCCKTLRTYL